MASFKVGELAAAAGVGRDTIRYYERMGLLEVATRNSAGYRIYGANDLERLKFIRSVQELGFNLEQVRTLLEASAAGPAELSKILCVAQAKLKEAKDTVDRLSQVEHALVNLSKGSMSCSTKPIWTYLRSERAAAEHVV